MKKFKRILRLFGLIALVLLASVGMAMGAPPPPVNTRKEDSIEIIDDSTRPAKDEEEEIDLSEVKL